MDRPAFLITWFLSSVTTLVFASLFLIYISTAKEISGINTAQYQSFKSLPAAASDLVVQDTKIDRDDGRSVIVEQFFKGYKSPLAGASAKFVEVADKYGLDYRLLPSIAMQESNGGKILPHNSYNPFGYGIYGKQVLRFNSFEDAIERVGRGLKQDYIDKGLTTPWEIMTKYTPPSLAKGGPWATGVSTFMAELQ